MINQEGNWEFTLLTWSSLHRFHLVLDKDQSNWLRWRRANSVSSSRRLSKSKRQPPHHRRKPVIHRVYSFVFCKRLTLKEPEDVKTYLITNSTVMLSLSAQYKNLSLVYGSSEANRLCTVLVPVFWRHLSFSAKSCHPPNTKKTGKFWLQDWVQ